MEDHSHQLLIHIHEYFLTVLECAPNSALGYLNLVNPHALPWQAAKVHEAITAVARTTAEPRVTLTDVNKELVARGLMKDQSLRTWWLALSTTWVKPRSIALIPELASRIREDLYRQRWHDIYNDPHGLAFTAPLGELTQHVRNHALELENTLQAPPANQAGRAA